MNPVSQQIHAEQVQAANAQRRTRLVAAARTAYNGLAPKDLYTVRLDGDKHLRVYWNGTFQIVAEQGDVLVEGQHAELIASGGGAA